VGNNEVAGSNIQLKLLYKVINRTKKDQIWYRLKYIFNKFRYIIMYQLVSYSLVTMKHNSSLKLVYVVFNYISITNLMH